MSNFVVARMQSPKFDILEIKMNRPSNKRNGDEVFYDALAWWKMQEKLLPVLSIIARRLLCVPATSAPSERVFSVAISKNCTAVTLIFFMIVGDWPRNVN